MCAAKILFELSGSIAAWKACGVISRLVQEGHEVQTIATAAALRFIGPATLEGLTGRAVKSDLWEPGAAMEHINLVKWADLVVLCPATTNTISRLAAGLADDLIGSLFLAHDWRKPYLVAPAMNPAMWGHPATVASVGRLRGWGVRVLPVARGRLACGDEGEGRLLEPEAVLEHIRAALPQAAEVSREGNGESELLAGACADHDVAADISRDDNGAGAPPPKPGARRLRVLVTAGGTEEPIDGVRAITNFSTGRTGALIADRFAEAGHDVTLLRARRAAAPESEAVRTETFSNFSDLEAGLRRLLGGERFDAVIHAAAVSDYSVAEIAVDGAPVAASSSAKIDSGRDVRLHLRPNPRLVDRLREWSANPALRVVAFKLTRGAEAAAARAAVETLFSHARADAVVHNDLAALDPASGRFPATIWRADGTAIRAESREALAAQLERLLSETAAATPSPQAIPAP